jgi:hypothetical protein
MSWVNSATGVSVTHITRTAVKQPIPTTHPTTGLIDCLLPGNTWTDPYTLTIPVGWVSGVYLAKLTTSITPSQPTTWQSYIIFVVREDGRNSDLYFQSSVTTFQAYNPWGGKSLYPHPGGIANKVSFNRPYAASSRSDLRYGTGAGEFFVMINASPLPAWEYNALRWMEKQSYDLTYCTDIDTHNTSGAGCLLNKSIKAFLSVGHDEYWSQAMRDNVKAARDRTTNPINLVFMGANACHFRIGLESSGSTPLRTMVCNKVNSADLWRNTEHEVSLIGVEFVRNSFDKPLTVVNPSGGHWAFDHTGINPGSSSTLPGLLGYEVDGEWIGVNPCFDFNTVGPNFGSGPYDTIKLADSIFQTCTQGYQTPTPVGGANGHGYMTVYTAALGPISDPHAQVFATGSMQWCWGLDAFGYPTKFSPPALVGSRVSSISQQITHNILQTFSGKTRYMLPP